MSLSAAVLPHAGCDDDGLLNNPPDREDPKRDTNLRFVRLRMLEILNPFRI